MKNRIILILAALCALTVLGACGGASTANSNAKPAYASANANANAASNSGSNTTTSNNNSASNTAAAPATEGAAQDFAVLNKTGVVVDKLFVSPADKEEWGEDILGQDQLADNQSVEIKFHPKEKAAKWDLKIQDTKGNSIEWHDLNLMEISKVTLHYADGKGTAEVE